MAQYYDQVKSMRSAKVGTIMPWGGDGNTGFLVSNIPKGWVVCKGQTVNASDYPLLASVIGDTYSATASMADASGNEYQFPYIDTAATFTFPNLSSKCMVDLESSYLDDPDYQMGQGSDVKDRILDTNGTKLGDLLVSGTGGGTASYFSNVKTTWQASADIDFTLNLTGNLYFKFSGMLLQAPDFVETIYTLRRKLGINHTPGHSHRDSIPTAQVQPTGPAIFRTDGGINQHNTASLGICGVSVSPVSCEFKDANPTQWANGSTDITFYGNANYENTLPRMTEPMEFVTDSRGYNYWGHVPATDWRQTGGNGTGSNAYDTNRGSGPKAEYQRQTVSGGLGVTQAIVNTEPMKSHKTQAHTGMHPRPILQRNRPNFYGYTRNGQTPPTQGGITDHPEAMTPFQVSNITLTENSNEITLPSTVDLGRTYSQGTGGSATTWTQYDAITPFMYVIEVIPTDNQNDCKYLHLQEGTTVQSVKKETNGTWTIRLDRQIKGDKAAGWGSVSARNLQFKYATYPTAMNQPFKDPISSDFGSHGHGSFEIAQGIGSMAGPPSHTASNADASSLSAQSLENALNIDCDTTQPSLTLTYIIKAY